MDRPIGAPPAVMWALYRSVVVKKELEGSALDFLVHLCSNPHL